MADYPIYKRRSTISHNCLGGGGLMNIKDQNRNGRILYCSFEAERNFRHGFRLSKAEEKAPRLPPPNLMKGPRILVFFEFILRDGPFDIQGGGWDFFEKNSLFPMRCEKNKMTSTKLKINSLFFI